jgi:membrane-bound lytic murein transglycosylase B
MLAVILLLLLFASAALPSEPLEKEAVLRRQQALREFLDEMTAKHGFDRAALEEAFRTTRSLPRIMELMEKASAPRLWEDYRSLFVTAEKIEAGERFWRENAAALELARQRYGVPEEIVTAVIGVETHYGRQNGKFKVLEALATLAFEYPRRAPLFRVELEHYLLLSREEALPLESPLGSYAGAMGIAQFMPGSYRRYAIDFDGDGKRDLFLNPADAIGSVANYLTAHGWQRNGRVAAEAQVEESGVESFRGAKLSSRYSLEELKARGVTVLGAEPANAPAIPLTLQTRSGPEYWLGFENFYVITRYNPSVSYAMVVFQLGREIRDRREASAVALDP